MFSKNDLIWINVNAFLGLASLILIFRAKFSLLLLIYVFQRALGECYI